MVLGIDRQQNKVRDVGLRFSAEAKARTRPDHRKPKPDPNREEVGRGRPAGFDSRDNSSTDRSGEPAREVEPGNSGNEMRLS
jgi:hypothetical protein